MKITLAGALVDVGQPVPGVLHISQLQKDPVKKVEDVLQEGQAVDVWVRRVRKDRIELTMIEPLRYEWKDLQPETVVKGKVVRLESYGAFVDIGAERPGMIHISELARGYVKDAKDVVKEGDEVEAMILSVDPKKRQIRLSIKSLQPELPAEEPVEREAKRAKRGKKAEDNTYQEAPEEPIEPQTDRHAVGVAGGTGSRQVKGQVRSRASGIAPPTPSRRRSSAARSKNEWPPEPEIYGEPPRLEGAL